LDGIAGPYEVAREVALLDVAGRIGCPVPGVAAYAVTEGDRRGFFAMEHVDGIVPTPGDVTRLIPDAQVRVDLGVRVAEEMARLHAADPAGMDIPALGTPPAPEDTGRQQAEKWTAAYHANALVRIPILDLALAWLRARSSLVSGRVSLVHTDLRVGNLIVRDGQLVSILDWETAHYSDPVADIAWFMLRTFRGRSSFAGRLIKPGDLLDAYEKAAGWRPTDESLTYWTVHSLTKSAIGCLQALTVFSDGRRQELDYANMAHSVYYSLVWLNTMLRDGEWGN
jgi:aminoglycoside phosphotransferase (APT) family kinase protein